MLFLWFSESRICTWSATRDTFAGFKWRAGVIKAGENGRLFATQMQLMRCDIETKIYIKRDWLTNERCARHTKQIASERIWCCLNPKKRVYNETLLNCLLFMFFYVVLLCWRGMLLSRTLTLYAREWLRIQRPHQRVGGRTRWFCTLRVIYILRWFCIEESKNV